MKFLITALALSSALSFAQSTNGGRPGGAGAGSLSGEPVRRVDSQGRPVAAGAEGESFPLFDNTCYMGGVIGGSMDGLTIKSFDLEVKDCQKEGDIIRCPDGVYRKSSDVNDLHRSSGKDGGSTGGASGRTTRNGSADR